MAIIYCPQCDSEIPEKEIVCPSCGFNLDTYDENEEDTNNEFNALLNAANKKLSHETVEQSVNSEEPVFSGSGAISQSQIDALLDGGVVDLTGSVSAAPETKEPEKPVTVQTEEKAKPIPTPETNGVEQKTVTAASASPSDEENSVQQTKPVKQKKVKNKEKKPKERKPVPSSAITFLVAVVALALGFCISLLMFGDMFRSAEESFAIKAANAVNSKLEVNEQLCVYKAYVKRGSAADECILYAVTDYKDVITASKYRVTVNKDNSNVINIYYTVDENSPEYIAMKESDDPETRVQASILKSYSDSIETAHREISIGSPSWVKVDISEINSNIKMKKAKTVQE